MENSGARILEHYKTINFMGFFEVFKNVLRIRRKLSLCVNQLKEWNPNCVIFIDSPGFNLRIAKYANELGIKTCYYISPKVWAWNKSRIKQIKASIDLMLVIIPFEKKFYKQNQVDVEYVGNPSLEAVDSHLVDDDFVSLHKGKRPIAILPGSRAQEIKSAVGVLTELVTVFRERAFLIATVDNVDQELYKPFEGYPNVELVTNKTYDVLKASCVAVINSGTASLEAALLDVPQVVVYRTSWVTFCIAKALLKIQYISLVNLILEKELVRELIQLDYNAHNIADELRRIENNQQVTKRISAGYAEIREHLGCECASENAAHHIYKLSRS